MEQRKRVVISEYYGFNNSGDDAILKAIVKDLKNGCKDIHITVFSNDPQSIKEIYDIEAVSRLNIISVIKDIYRSDMLISGGGSLFQDITSTRSIIYYLIVMKIAKLFKKLVYMLMELVLFR